MPRSSSMTNCAHTQASASLRGEEATTHEEEVDDVLGLTSELGSQLGILGSDADRAGVLCDVSQRDK